MAPSLMRPSGGPDSYASPMASSGHRWQQNRPDHYRRVLSPNSRSPQTVAGPTALRLDQTARCGSLSTMATGLDA